MSRVAVYGAIGDYKEHTPLIQRLIEDWDKSALYYETGTLLEGLEVDRKDYDFMRRIVHHLSENRLPSSDAELARRAHEQAQREEEQRVAVKEQVQIVGSVAYVLNIPGPIGTAALYARVAGDAKIGVAGEAKGDMVDLSLRTVSPKLDLNTILRRECKRFGGVGGGHPQAAGARIPTGRLMEFLKALDSSATVE